MLTVCPTPYPDNLIPFGLEHCTNLKSIHFDCIPLWHPIGRARRRKWVPDILAQVTSCVVTELVFTLEVRREEQWYPDISDQLDSFDWSGVIDVLHSQFDQLRRVCVALSCENHIYPTVSRLVREDRFRVLHDQEILFVENIGVARRCGG